MTVEAGACPECGVVKPECSTCIPEKDPWVCNLCGSDQVEERAWVDVNTGAALDGGTEWNEDDLWCRSCQNHPTKFVYRSEYTPGRDDDT